MGVQGNIVQQDNRTPRGGDDTITPMVVVRGLSKSYGTHLALRDISLQIAPAEIFGLIGPNGAGKSTLIKMLATLLPPTAGTAEVAGCDLRRDQRRIRSKIGYVPQLLSADGSLIGYENLLLSARLYLVPRRERAVRIKEALGRADLADAADRLSQHYSGGMLRRLEIAQSTLHRPPVLIMDEPTVGLDPVARAAVWNHVRDLRAHIGTTILVTTHSMEEVDELCDRVGVLHHGKLERVGRPADLTAEISPGATLYDVFAKITGNDTGEEGNYRDIRQTRGSAAEHG